MIGALLLTALLAAPPALPVDHDRLPALLTAEHFRPPRRFKALVIELNPDSTRAFDWQGTADDREDWWPASTVKLFAAVAALESTAARGFSPAVKVTYRDAQAVQTWSLESIVERALIPSSNPDFDRLVELVGADALNDWFQSRGLRDTRLLRAYAHRVRDPQTGEGTLLFSREIALDEQARHLTLPARSGIQRTGCPDHGNCTTLLDLAETLRRVMQHEQLSENERFALGPAELKLLRTALEARRPRGNGVVDGLTSGFGPKRPVRLLHKPGYALRWFSDVVWVEPRDPAVRTRWLVAMAGAPGRRCLDDAARRVGRLLARGALSP